MPKKAFFALDEERRQDLLNKAMDIHNSHDYEKITMKLLLDSLELNPATFYRYFEDRDDLYIYMVSVVEDKLADYVAANHPELTEALFYETIDVEKALSPRELAIDDSLIRAPDHVLLKYYTGIGKDASFNHCKNALRKLRYDGELRGQVDDDLVSFFYATALLNLALFYREFGITDLVMQRKIRSYFYRDFLRYGIMSKRPEDEDSKN